MKQLFALLLCIISLSAVEISNPTQDHIYKLKEKVLDFTLQSQHKNRYSLSDKNQYLMITYDKKSTNIQNNFMIKRVSLLKSTRTLLIVDTSTIPAAIFTLFVDPTMKRVPLPLLYSDDIKFSKMFPYKENYITVIKLKNRVIKKIMFVKSEADLKKVFKLK